MIRNVPSKTDERTESLRNAIEHRATWMGLLMDEAKKKGLDTSFAHAAIRRCGVLHGMNKFPRTDDLAEFARAFANEESRKVFEMELIRNDDRHLHIDFHYCPLVAAWIKAGLPLEDMPELCDTAMEGDRGIVSTYDKFSFALGKTIAKGDDVCEIRLDKVEN